MPFAQILIPLIYSFFLFHVAFALGYFVLGKIQVRRDNFLFNISYSTLLGYGILAYLTLILSYFSLLNKLSVFLFALLVLFLGYRSLYYFYRNLKKVVTGILKQNSLNKILFGLLILLILLGCLSTFMPPFRGDTITYHLPEAEMVVNYGIFTKAWESSIVNLQAASWVPSLPLLIETLYALCITIYGFTLTHLIHYQIFLALILAIYVFLRRRFTKTHGLLAGIFIFTLFELVVNATVGYVDAAMVSFNIAGLLIFIDWFFSNRKSSLILSALLLGLGAGVKYLAFYNLAVVVLFLLIKIVFIDKRRIGEIIKVSSLFFGFWLITAGFWYLKNLILYLNPVYPFFSTLPIRWECPYPRTLTGFFTMPFRVFIEPHYYPVLLGFLTLPFIFLIKKLKLIQKNKKLIIFLFTYLFAFFALWFFIGSQIRRYAMDGQVVLMILTAIILGTILIKIIERVKLIWLVILLIFVSIPLIFSVAQYEEDFLGETIKLQIGYFLGIKNKYDFYRFQNFGEEFFISGYINENFQNEKIINSLCDSRGNFFLNHNNRFVPLTGITIEKDEDIWLQVSEYLKKNDINYLLEAWEEKEKNFQWRSGSCTPEWEKYKDEILPLENLIKEHSNLIFSNDEKGVKLYRINLE